MNKWKPCKFLTCNIGQVFQTKIPHLVNSGFSTENSYIGPYDYLSGLCCGLFFFFFILAKIIMGFFYLVCNLLLQYCNNGSKTKNTIIPETHRVHQIRYFCWETISSRISSYHQYISSRISSYHQSKLDTSVGRLSVPEYLPIIGLNQILLLGDYQFQNIFISLVDASALT